jgi:hypothetical protein
MAIRYPVEIFNAASLEPLYYLENEGSEERRHFVPPEINPSLEGDVI